MPLGIRRAMVLLMLAGAVAGAACTGGLFKQYEYEEELYLYLDGSAQLNINASTAALAARLEGEPVDLEVHMAPESILATTLTLFAATIVAVVLTFAAAVWWIARRGREADLPEPHL